MQTFAVEAYHEETQRIVCDVFQTMLRCEVYPTDLPWEPAQSSVTAAIFFAGAWRGAVLVETSEHQACQWTSRLMSLPIPEAFTDDVQDALGELVNMIGGNLKSVLPRGVGLSMPTVVQGTNYSVRVCGGSLTDSQNFLADCGSFRVTLVEMVEPE
jgi:chemotaxis protein CheX